jgi:hypothetical protein
VSLQKINSIIAFKLPIQYDTQDQQGNAAFNERNLRTTHQQEPAAKSRGPHSKNKTGRKAEHGQDNDLNVHNNVF